MTSYYIIKKRDNGRNYELWFLTFKDKLCSGHFNFVLPQTQTLSSRCRTMFVHSAQKKDKIK
jgi:hypothetical protein